MTSHKVVLCILDGWGISSVKENNGINLARKPFWDSVWEKEPSTLLQASENFVGLPLHQMGNSEVGHMTIGAGRTIYQDLPKIDRALKDQSIEKNDAYQQFVESSRKGSKRCHLWGLFSPGGVHSHENHFIYFAKSLAQQGFEVFLHLVSDGRDTPPQSFLHSLRKLNSEIKAYPNIQIATISGRYYAMDRDKRWERTQKAYDVMTQGILQKNGRCFDSLFSYIQESYDNKITDEFILPASHHNYEGMKKGDTLLTVNFRADRVIQLLTALVEPEFNSFEKENLTLFNAVIGLREYSDKLSKYVPAIFKNEGVSNSLGEVLSQHNLKQLRIAETEKFAHVSFFFNGGLHEPVTGEERILIQSPKVATYDLKPEMSAYEMTEILVDKIHSKEFSFILVNYANPDMVGHTGNQEAIVKAITTVDNCTKEIYKACKEEGYILIITADHGNAEEMLDVSNNQPHTAHTCNPVPFLILNYKRDIAVRDGGTLADIAPTILQLMAIKQPDEMTGQSLIPA